MRGLSLDQESFQEVYQVDEIVWAKVSGHPWWPAHIQAIDDYADDQEGWLYQRYHVAFFGDSSGPRAHLAFAYVKPFQDFFSEFSSKAKANRPLTEAINLALANVSYNYASNDDFSGWNDTLQVAQKVPQEDKEALYNPDSDPNKAPKSKPGKGKTRSKRKAAQLSEHEGPEAQGEKNANQPSRGRGRSRNDEPQEKQVARSISKQDVRKSAQKRAPYSIRQRSYLQEREKMLNKETNLFSQKELRNLFRSWKRQREPNREGEKGKIMRYLETIEIEPGDLKQIEKVIEALDSEEKDARLQNIKNILQQVRAKEKKNQEEKAKLEKERKEMSDLLNQQCSEESKIKKIRRGVSKLIWKALKVHPQKLPLAKEVAVQIEELIFNQDKKMSQRYSTIAMKAIKGLYDHEDLEVMLKWLKSKHK